MFFALERVVVHSEAEELWLDSVNESGCKFLSSSCVIALQEKIRHCDIVTTCLWPIEVSGLHLDLWYCAKMLAADFVSCVVMPQPQT